MFSAIIYRELPSFFDSASTDKIGKVIGLATNVKGHVRVRFGESISWKQVELNERIYGDSYLFSGEGSQADFIFVDESSLKLDQNSMVYLDKSTYNPEQDKRSESMNLDFVNGQIDIKINNETMINSIKVNNSVINLKEGQAHFRIINHKQDEKFDVSVLNGSVDLKERGKSFKVISGEKLQISKDKAPEKGKISKELREKLAKLETEPKQNQLFKDFKNRSDFAYYLEKLGRVLINFFK